MLKNLPTTKKTQIPLGQENPWRKKWLPIPIFLPGKSHGQRSLAVYSSWGCKGVRHKLVTKQAVILYLITSIVVLVERGNSSKIAAGVKAMESASKHREKGLRILGLFLPLLLPESVWLTVGHICPQGLQGSQTEALVFFPKSSFAVKSHPLSDTRIFVGST